MIKTICQLSDNRCFIDEVYDEPSSTIMTVNDLLSINQSFATSNIKNRYTDSNILSTQVLHIRASDNYTVSVIEFRRSGINAIQVNTGVFLYRSTQYRVYFRPIDNEIIQVAYCNLSNSSINALTINIISRAITNPISLSIEEFNQRSWTFIGTTINNDSNDKIFNEYIPIIIRDTSSNITYEMRFSITAGSSPYLIMKISQVNPSTLVLSNNYGVLASYTSPFLKCADVSDTQLYSEMEELTDIVRTQLGEVSKFFITR